jgi:hypothetical protein
MRSIMPPGYSVRATHRRFTQQLLETRAKELVNPNARDRKRIAAEVEEEVQKKLKEIYGASVTAQLISPAVHW